MYKYIFLVYLQVGANLFAWSETSGNPWPLNYYFVWYIVAVAGLLSLQVSRGLPKTIERRKREPIGASLEDDEDPSFQEDDNEVVLEKEVSVSFMEKPVPVVAV